MAEGFARHYGSDVMLASSSGLSSTHAVARDTIDVMTEKGVDISSHFPKDFDAGFAANFDVIVNISGFELPPVKGPLLLEWRIRDPFGEELAVHRQVRDEIEDRVKSLVADLGRNGTVTDFGPVGQRIAPGMLRRPRLWQRFTRWL
jgi:arsenate reductase (thioredoxin)